MKGSSASAHEYRIVPAGKFKATCLQLMEEINQKPLTIIMTKRGKPVAQMSAASPDVRIIPPTVQMADGNDFSGVAKPIAADTREAEPKKNLHKKRKNKKKHK